jgi:hypothetical protein
MKVSLADPAHLHKNVDEKKQKIHSPTMCDNLEGSSKLKKIAGPRKCGGGTERKSHQFITQLFNTTIQKRRLSDARRDVASHSKIKVRLC